MILTIQIKTFLISILFGFLFSLSIDIVKKRLFKMKKIWQILYSLAHIIILSLLYFMILLKFNNGIIHPYYLFAILIGYISEFILVKISKRIVLLLKKWYNSFGG